MAKPARLAKPSEFVPVAILSHSTVWMQIPFLHLFLECLGLFQPKTQRKVPVREKRNKQDSKATFTIPLPFR
jgi:hypothetical protein